MFLIKRAKFRQPENTTEVKTLACDSGQDNNLNHDIAYAPVNTSR